MRLTRILDLRVDGRPVALARMLVAFAFAVCVLESAAVLGAIAGGKLHYPVLSVIPAPTPVAVQSFLIAGLLAAICLALGYFSGASALLGSALLAGALLWDQQTYSSHHQLVTLLLAYLTFAQAGQRWGFDRRRNGGDTDVPWWPQLLMMTQVGVVYLFAALSKINPRFLSGEPLQQWMWLDLSLWAFQALAVATVSTEIFLAIALWIPRVRVLAVLAGLGLHASIVIGLTDQTLVLIAFAAASVSTYWLFLSRPPFRAWAHPRAGSEPDAMESRSVAQGND